MKRLIVMTLLAGVLFGCDSANTSSSLLGLSTEMGNQSRIVTPPTSNIVAALATRETPPQTALVYYAVDSGEPFHQAAIDFEVRSLRSVCDAQHPNTNWIAFVNSWITNHNNLYMSCVGGKISQGQLSADLTAMVTELASPTYNNAEPTVGLKIPLQHPQSMNELFKNYPMAHPEVLWYLLNFTVTTVFPPANYSLILDLKSHGSNELLLAGLTDDEQQTKTDRQKDVLNAYMTKMSTAALASNGNIDVRNTVACQANGGQWQDTACFCPTTGLYMSQFFGTCERKLGFTGLGAISGLGYDQLGLGAIGTKLTTLTASLGSNGLGSNGLGSNGLGSNGLGSNGLGSNGLGSNGLGSNGLGSNGLGSNGLGSNGLGSNGLGSNGLGSNGLGSNGLGADGLGSNGLGADGLGADGLGADGLGADGLGVNGLGFNDVGTAGFGLHADSHFGTPVSAMLTVLGQLQAKGVQVGFIIFEACETNFASNPTATSGMASLTDIGAYYSARGELWYRNLDWQTIFQAAGQAGSTQFGNALVKVLTTATGVIPNFVEPLASPAPTAAAAATTAPTTTPAVTTAAAN